MKRIIQIVIVLMIALIASGGAVPPFTTIYIRTLLDDPDAQTARETLILGANDDVTFGTVTIEGEFEAFLLLNTGDLFLLNTGDKLLLNIFDMEDAVLWVDGNGLISMDTKFTWDTGTSKLTIADSAVLGSNSAVFQPNADSTTFFQIKNAAGDIVGNWDTTRKRLGIGTNDPNAPLEVKGLPSGDVGGFPSGLLHVTNASNAEFANSIITGHNSFNGSGNTQLWYLGSTKGSNNNIAFINRQDGFLSLWTNDTARLKITNDGNTKVGDGGTTDYVNIDATGVLGLNGLAGLQLPHMMQSDSTTQTVANTSAAQVVTFNTDVHHFGITRTTSSRFTILKEASYLIAISALCDTTVANKDIEIWLRINGNDVANSNTIVHLGTAAETTLAVTYIKHFDVNDYFEFWMTGESTGCRLLATAAGTTPTRPACPSIIMTCNYVGVD